MRDFAKTLVISKLKMEETYFLGVSLIRLELVVLIDTEPGKVGYTCLDADAGIVTPAPLQGEGQPKLPAQRSAPAGATRGHRSRI